MGVLDGKRVIITGASRGIGAAMAERFVAEGAHVAITARTVDQHDHLAGSMAETLARCRQHGDGAVAIAADLSDSDSRAALVPAVEAALGGTVDVLVNNAVAGIHRSMEEFSARHRRVMFEVNFEAPIELAQAVIPGMRERGEGWIVNISSGALLPIPGPPFHIAMPGNGIYGATKAALDRASNQLAAELWGTGVRVNLLDPKKAVASQGAIAHLEDRMPADFYAPVEVMVEAALALGTCGPDQTGLKVQDQTLLDDLGRRVMTLNGSAPLDAQPVNR